MVSIDLAEGTDERMSQGVSEGNDEKIIKRSAIVWTSIPGLWSVCYEALHTRHRVDAYVFNRSGINWSESTAANIYRVRKN